MIVAVVHVFLSRWTARLLHPAVMQIHHCVHAGRCGGAERGGVDKQEGCNSAPA